MAKKKKKTSAKKGTRKATRTAAKKKTAGGGLLTMVQDLGKRFEELKKRTSEGAERAAEIAREIRKTVIDPRIRAFQNARKKR